MKNSVSNGTRGSGPNEASRTWRTVLTDLAFPEPGADPCVSIIVPAYGEIESTCRCLESIARLRERSNYEVIVADDCSPDESAFLQLVPGLRYFRNPSNLGFLKTCNKAALKARGTYLVFLNNDTEVQAGWLDSMVDLFLEAPDVGVVGSKLVYPDGTLQEAGAIYWQDANGANYGRGDPNPSRPKFNYVREVDKVSGASLMVPKTVFSEVGGFDPIFAPAYKEDADLCFAVRARGLRVLYQPHSVVVHHEGLSHGQDVTEGVKKYQVINRPKFVEKWRKELEFDHFPHDRQCLSMAKERPHGKPIALVIDDKVPEYDRHAGGMGMFHYVQLLQELGFRVVFVSDNPKRREPYSTKLETMGVETHHGSKQLQDMYAEYGSRIAVTWLSRPHEATKHIDRVREQTSAPVIYCGRDLHFLRAQRRSEVEGGENLSAEIALLKEMETRLFRSADAVVTFSHAEAETIQALEPQAAVEVLPPYVLETNPVADCTAHGMDILMIGGFGHSPNVDAALWFAKECWPEISRKVPLARLVIIGSDPPESIESLASDNLVVAGFVPQLEPFFREARLSVAPLRYGAGVKGKIVTSLAAGCPVVATEVGVEGMQLRPEIDVLVANSATEIIDSVVRLSQDDELHARLQSAGVAYIGERYSRDRVRQKFGDLLQRLGALTN